MGLEVISRNDFELIDEICVHEDFSNLSNLIIPFSTIFRSESEPDIYTGEESIPFREKESEFKQILINEFLFEI